MKYTNRVRAEQKELERLLPTSLNETAQGILLLREAGSANAERKQMLIQPGYDCSVNDLVTILKRMTDDVSITEGTSATNPKTAFLAGIRKEKKSETANRTTEKDLIHDTMANIPGIETERPGDQAAGEIES